MIILSTFLVYVSCQQAVDIDSEKEAIKAVIQKSANAWTDRNYESMEEVWLHDQKIMRIGASPGGYGITEGWENMSTRYKTAFGNNPEPSPSKEVFVNHRMSIFPEVAHTTVDRYLLTEEGDTIQKALHTYILEKSAGEWKIVNLSSVMSWIYDMGLENLAISETYHQLDPDDVDNILTDDFVGRDEIGGTWTKARHKIAWTENVRAASDSIIHQMANGNYVTTRFLRSGAINGKKISGEALQVKRFEDDKIAEIWEYGFGVFKQ